MIAKTAVVDVASNRELQHLQLTTHIGSSCSFLISIFQGFLYQNSNKSTKNVSTNVLYTSIPIINLAVIFSLEVLRTSTRNDEKIIKFTAISTQNTLSDVSPAAACDGTRISTTADGQEIAPGTLPNY